MKRMIVIGLALMLAIGSLAACGTNKESGSASGGASGSESASAGESASNSESTGTEGTSRYENISQEEALKIMEEEEGYIILDVRTKEEFDAGHIPEAVNIPVETIGDKEPEELPDKDQLLLIYCRSGNRSKQASEKLVELGYTNILEFGGINTWLGEVVTD